MSVYVVKRKDQKPTEFICSAPTFEMALRLYRDLEQIDKEMGEYQKDRYGIIQREYCPAHAYNCDHYMLGICSRRYPSECRLYKEYEDDWNSRSRDVSSPDKSMA